MSAAAESNDDSGTFWPGYVDAISNLAVNLLFIIAIMAIVVIAYTLQVQELLKRKDRALADDIAFTVMEKKDTQRGSGASAAQSSTNAESAAMQRYAGGNTDRVSEQPNSAEGERKSAAGMSAQRTTTEPVTHEVPSPNQTPLPAVAPAGGAGMSANERQNLEQVSRQQQAKIREQAEEIRSLQEAIRTEQQARASIARQTPAAGRAPKEAVGPEGDEVEAGRVEEVTATRPTPAPDGRNVASAVQSGVIVNFARDVTLLTDAEAQDLAAKLKSFAPLDGTRRWKVSIVTPKGFSEAGRLAFYRANAVRNVLLREGVPGTAIELRVMESDQPTANSARVVARPAQ